MVSLGFVTEFTFDVACELCEGLDPKNAIDELSLRPANLYQVRGQLAEALSFLVRAELWEQLLQLVDDAWGPLSLSHAQEDQSQLAAVLYEWAVARLMESDPVGP